MGEIERIWKTENEIFSVKTLDKEDVLDLTKKRKHLQVKNEKMLEILQNLQDFQIMLFYEGKEDIYFVKKLS